MLYVKPRRVAARLTTCSQETMADAGNTILLLLMHQPVEVGVILIPAPGPRL